MIRFYAMAGGQAGDRGVLASDGSAAEVTDTTSPLPGLHVHHVRVTHWGFETGMVVRSDLLQAEVKELETNDMLIRAESQAAVARAGLNMAMGRPLGTPATLPETVDIPTLTERDLDALTAEAIEARPDLKAAAARAGAAEKMVKVARAGYYPEIGVGGAYEANAEDFIGADGPGAVWPLYEALLKNRP